VRLISPTTLTGVTPARPSAHRDRAWAARPRARRRRHRCRMSTPGAGHDARRQVRCARRPGQRLPRQSPPRPAAWPGWTAAWPAAPWRTWRSSAWSVRSGSATSPPTTIATSGWPHGHWSARRARSSGSVRGPLPDLAERGANRARGLDDDERQQVAELKALCRRTRQVEVEARRALLTPAEIQREAMLRQTAIERRADPFPPSQAVAAWAAACPR
jgi:hypothetical protein